MATSATQLARLVAELSERVTKLERGSRLSSASMHGGPLLVYSPDDHETVRQTIGQQPDGTFTVVDSNGPPPPMPSAPLIEERPGALVVTWDGTFVGGVSAPADWDHVEVHVSTTPDYEPTDETEITTIHSLKGGSVTLALDPVAQYVRLQAVSTSGVESEPTAEFEATPLPASTGEGGVKTYYTDEPPIGLDAEDDGSLWFDTNDGNHPYRWDGDEWISIRDATIADAQQTAEDALEAATTDGEPPSASPTPTVVGGLGAVQIRWAPVVNNDPVKFRVYIDTTAGFMPGPGNLVVPETAGSSFTYRPQPPDYSATYYVRIVEFDADGDAPVSDEASAQMFQVTNADVAAEYGYFGNIAVNQLTGGMLSADLLLASTMRTAESGARVEMGPFGIVIYNAAGTPDTVFPTDGSGSSFKGDVEAGGLTVTGGASFRSVLNEISRGAVFTLAASTTTPRAAPTIVVDWPDPIVQDLFSGNYGLVWTGTDFATVGDSEPPLIQQNTESDVSLPSGHPQPWGGLTKIGTSWYTLGWKTTYVELPPPSGWKPVWYVTKYSAAGATQAQAVYTPIDGPWGSGASPSLGLAPAAIGTDGTNVLIAEFDDANNRFRIEVRNATTLAVISTTFTSSNNGFNGPVVAVARGTFDFGATRTIILSKDGNHFWPFDTSATPTYQPNDAWTTPRPGSMSGFAWDGTRFWSTRAKNVAGNAWVFKHTTHTWTGLDPADYHARLTWRDTDPSGGVHETDQGPAIKFQMRKRAAITMTSPTIPDQGGPDDPDAVAFYLSNTTNARTSMWRQTLPAAGVNTIVVGDGIVFSGVNPPLANDFPSATPGVFRSAALDLSGLPAIEFQGDGTGRLLGVTLAQLDHSLRSRQHMFGGGLLKGDTTGISWSQRWLVGTAGGRSALDVPDGYFDVSMPSDGTVITGVGGASNQTVASGRIPLPGWHALYYILPYGSGNATVAANFRIATYTADFAPPPHWALICFRSAEPASPVYIWGNGEEMGVWTNLALTSPWASFDAAIWSPLAYMKQAGIVYLRGLIKTGTTGLIATLPAGFRPAWPVMAVGRAGGASTTRIDVETDGEIRAQDNGSNNSTSLSLYNICFQAAN